MSALTTLIEHAEASVDALEPARFAAEADLPHTVVVDVREADERVTTGSIAHAIHVPRGLLEFRADPDHPMHDPRLDHDARVLLYCSRGARSALAAASLITLGYTNVTHLRGGLDAWLAAGFPLVGRIPPAY